MEQADRSDEELLVASRRPACFVSSTTAPPPACWASSCAAPWTRRSRPTSRPRPWPRPSPPARFRDRGEGSATAWLFAIAGRQLARICGACASRTRPGGDSAWSHRARPGRRRRIEALIDFDTSAVKSSTPSRSCAPTSARRCACASSRAARTERCARARLQRGVGARPREPRAEAPGGAAGWMR